MVSIPSKKLTATIASAGTNSTSITVTGYERLAVMVSDLTTDTYVTVQVSHDNSNFEELYDRTLGTPADVTLAKQKGHVIDIAGWNYVRFVAATGQGEAREIVCRGL